MNILWKNLFEFDKIESGAEWKYFRILEIAIIALVLYSGWEWALHLPNLEKVIDPPGIAGFIDVSFMFGKTASVVVAVLLTVCAIVGLAMKKQKYLYPIAFVLFHLIYVARFSQGKMPHGDNLTGMALLSFALGFIFFKNRLMSYRFSKGMMVFYAGWAYFMAAICKLSVRGLHWADGRHLWLWINERATDTLSQYGAFDSNAMQDFILGSHSFATMNLAGGLFVEFLAFLFWFKKFRPFMAIAFILMHLGILFAMNITFDKYIIILILIAFPWVKWIGRKKGDAMHLP